MGFQIVLPLALVVALSCGQETQKKTAPFHTRTELKVSRSLNPESVRTLNVMTRDGNVAQLIVKRKDRSNPESSAGNLGQSRFVEIGSSNNDKIPQGYFKSNRFRFGVIFGYFSSDSRSFVADPPSNIYRTYKRLGSNPYSNYLEKDVPEVSTGPNSSTPKFVPNWIPLSQIYYQPQQLVRLDSIAVVKNASDFRTAGLGNVIDSDRYVF